MKPLENIISSVCKRICKYEYLETKRVSNAKQCDKEAEDTTLEDFTVRKIQQLHDFKSYMNHLSTMKSLLQDADMYVPINVTDNVNLNQQRKSMYEVMKLIRKVGFPAISASTQCIIFVYPLKDLIPPSIFYGREILTLVLVMGKIQKLLFHYVKHKIFYSRANRKAVKQTLHIIGITKSFKAEYLLRTLLGDASAPHDLQQGQILQRFKGYVSHRDDIMCDF